MATDNQGKEVPINVDSDAKRSSQEFLPRYFRTLPNKKFLAATLDQIIQTGVAEKLNAYYGRKNAKAAVISDSYITDIDADRQNYQFEPATVIQDDLRNVNFYKDYIDYINQLGTYGANVGNNSRNNSQEYYTWNPHINWDKFVNFREYYWMPFGPAIIDIFGQTQDVISTYTVTLANEEEQAYIFSPNGVTRNPTLKLYRGQTYKFEIDCPGHPIAFSTNREFTPPQVLVSAAADGIRAPDQYDVKLYDLDSYDYGNFYLVPPSSELTEKIQSDNISNIFELGVTGENQEGQSVVFVEKGTIEFTIPNDAPDTLFYVSKNDIDYSGLFQIYDIEENTKIDVENEILGKKTYRSSNGVELINGMRIRFGGDVTPEKYASTQWYIEGVGDKITLIDERDLEVFRPNTDDIIVPFDLNPFDRVPFSQAAGFSATKDYIVSNRASLDKNQWARTNKWIHKSVIEEAARINNLVPEFNQDFRAKRPIIEFEANLRLANFGTIAKTSVDLVDTFTTDVFSIIEGSSGYNIDGIDLVNGMRILFTADTDVLANNKIYEVKFITFQNNRQITLIEVDNGNPLENEIVYVKNGETLRGKMFWFDGAQWIKAQDKTELNQAPIFDLYDNEDVSIFDYPSVIEPGTKIFSYKEGTGTIDNDLRFSLDYRVVENSGDILFNFNLLSDEYQYQVNNQLKTISAEKLRLKKYKNRDEYSFESAWKTAHTNSYQNVIRIYYTTLQTNRFEIDVYDNILELDDLWHRVYVNNKLQKINLDYSLEENLEKLYISFVKELDNNSIVEIKTRSSAKKNKNGYYETPINLERNPLNSNPTQFTFGEVSDHVNTIVEELNNFEGVYPGPSNLDNLGNVTPYGRKFVQHSGPINISSYHLLSKEHNIIKAMSAAQNDYGKFKREFIKIITEADIDKVPHEFVDYALAQINLNKTNRMPYYFSDMIGSGNFLNYQHTVTNSDNVFYALPQIFNLSNLNNHAVYVYINQEQLIHGKDYIFTENGFVQILSTINVNDILEIHFFENTDGSFIPPTPTKLGLYPSFEPSIYIDYTYPTPTKVIQGHDGSIITAYNDYRDDVILDLEKRIFNNIKISYNSDILDIHDYVPGSNRKTDFSKDEINQLMISDFVKWLELVGNLDYTDINDFYVLENSFSYNYANCKSPEGENIRGYWRNIYKNVFDTDRPHTHPWEMLGFTIEPSWWQELYGPLPYTRDNLVMWSDIAEGKVHRPNRTPFINKKYIRPNLLNYLPVDSKGNLLSPLQSGYAKNFSQINSRQALQFGDEGPIESAWRKSSNYPFSLIKSWIINQPSKMFGTSFDRARIIRDDTGELIYTESNQRLQLEDLVFPNSVDDDQRVYASGLVSYMQHYLSGESLVSYTAYKKNLKEITNKLSIRLAGFTDKSKFNLILDSRTPLNEGNVFVPQENYDIFLNTSSPTRALSYSGVLIEKRSTGFLVRGYNKEYPLFSYLPPIDRTQDPVIKVGGISEDFVTWTAGKTYTKTQIVEYEGSYYRATESHTANESLDVTKFAKLPELPIVGGVTATNRKLFESNPIQIQYGTVFTEIQEVVDFLLGYGAYLESQGFKFNYFNDEYGLIENWLFSVKEFLFWTTQNWAAGAILTLSPGATTLSFETQNEVVDNMFDGFYDYSVLKSDGQPLPIKNISIDRTSENSFSISVNDTNEGIYGVKIPLVQKEHIALLDNITVFKDIIYDPEPGYRQERIRVLGYRTDGWNGSFNIPGFIYDDVSITRWETWKDYNIGSVVKYKEFYYTALENISGSDTFDSNLWQQLSEKPEPKLQGNLEYKTNQFADFYDLDTDNFDVEQQKLAQHLIGYQKRNYLQNIINDDVSQYKFYQGMIQEKGSTNSLTKLFDKLSNSDQDSLEFYEEWAIRLGNYGAVDGIDQVEFTLDESLYRLEPQPVNLVDVLPVNEVDLTYNLIPSDTYLKSENYNHKPFPLLSSNNEYLKTAGYVHTSDVDFILANYDDILNQDISAIKEGSYFWIGNKDNDWTVLQYSFTQAKVVSAVVNQDGSSTDDGAFEINFNKPISLKSGDIIGLVNTSNDKFYKVVKAGTTFITIAENLEDEIIENGFLAIFHEHRYSKFNDLVNVAQTDDVNGLKVWIDDNFGKWGTYENSDNVSFNSKIFVPEDSQNNLNPANIISVNDRNTLLAVGTPDDNHGKVFVYARPTPFNNYQADIELTVDKTFNARIELSEAVTVTVGEIIKQEQSLAKGEVVESNGNVLVVKVLENTFTTTDDLFLEDSTSITNDDNNINIVSITYNTPDVTDPNPGFGSAVSVSPDGKYILVGSPKASNVKTNVVGEFDKTADYSSGQIVEYLGKKWKAELPVSAEVPFRPYVTFNSSADIGIETPYILTGAYPFDNVENLDHILVRVPTDIYNAVGLNQKIVLYYINALQNATTIQEPFNGTITNITNSTLNTVHTIESKIDAILYIDTPFIIPNVGDVLNIGSTTIDIVDVFVQNKSVSIYINNIIGSLPTTGILEKNNFEIGSFELVSPDQSYPELGNFFKIPINNYTSRDVLEDASNRLVIVDVLDSTENENYIFRAIEENAFNVDINSDHDYVKYASVLSFSGNVEGIEQDVLSSKMVLRLPANITDRTGNILDYTTDVSNIDPIRIKPDPSSIIDLESLNLNSFVDIDLTITELWDGWIDVVVDTPPDENSLTFIYPRVGNIIFDENGSSAVVQYVQTKNNVARCYVTGTQNTIWPNGTDYNDGSRLFITDTSGSADRLFTQTEFGFLKNASLVGNNLATGFIAVFDNVADIPVPLVQTTNDFSYWIYETRTLQGLGIDAIYPQENSRYWSSTTSIEVNRLGNPSGLVNEGLLTIYSRSNNGIYSKEKELVTDFREDRYDGSSIIGDDFLFGSQIKTIKNNNLYISFVKAADRIIIIYNGSTDTGTYDWRVNKEPEFRGTFHPTENYSQGNIVKYQDDYYQANTNHIDAGDAPQPTGQTDSNWTFLTRPVGIGYIPADNVVDFKVSDSGNIVILLKNNVSENNEIEIYKLIDDVYTLSQTIFLEGNIEDYAEKIALNNDGTMIAVGCYKENKYPSFNIESITISEQAFADDLIVTTTDQNNIEKNDLIEITGSTTEGVNNEYIVKEIINSNIFIVTTNSEIYSSNIDLETGAVVYNKENTNVIPLTGSVKIYKNTHDTYELFQILNSPSSEVGEAFGYSVDFSGNNLVVGSASGDLDVDEEFSDNTYFDNYFTKFKKRLLDYGKVYHFEYLENVHVFSSLINNQQQDSLLPNYYPKFGYNLMYNNGHLYLPFTLTSSSEILEYRTSSSSAWKLIREEQPTVDTNKIKTIFVYDKIKNLIIDYVDFIDPIQGRFAGIVEQELSYKTYYDPAIYDFGHDEVTVDNINPWGPKQVGKTWFDLTNAKFINPYHRDLGYSANNWNNLFNESSIDIYEWVESDLLPSEWNNIADTTGGLAEGISGQSKYDDTVYCERKIFDNVSQTFSTKYYFWVKDKKTIPNILGRKLNISEITKLIEDPASQGYKFVALISNNKFAMFNMKDLIKSKDVALHVSFYTIDNQQQNMHSEYQIISEGLGTSKPKDIIVEKWIDSLVGYDKNTREVPDPLLSPRQKYGNLNRPRQSWFVNRIEALKQFIERVNYVLSSNLIVDEYNLGELESKDPIPTELSKLYDMTVDTEVELQYIYTNNLEQAIIEPVIVDGRITEIKILQSGKGYKLPPNVEIVGDGVDFEIELQISDTGRVIAYNIINSGYGYLENTRLIVRPFSVLVNNDTSITGKWSIYSWNNIVEKWNRIILQDYDVSLYWDYIDWYETGYNQFTETQFIIDNPYNLPSINDSIGDIVKIKNVGAGGWLLLEKENEEESDYDYSINYKTVGKQNGTIKLSESLYDFSQSTASFDGFNYDVSLYDNVPIKETRIIIENIKNNLFVDQLETEFNKLFFSSIRYVLSEQLFVDWLFKTSFVKAKHNFGELDQRITYQNDNLKSYEEYAKEVKPFKTKIREYLSAYNKTDNTQTIVSDFDLTAKYNPLTGKIEPPRTIVVDNVIQAANVQDYPNKNWFDNASFYVNEVQISDHGEKYTTIPQITFVGGGGTGAKAQAYVNSGKITSIKVTDPGTGYISTPTVIISGSIQEGGREAQAFAVLENSSVRKIKTTVKFDRLTGDILYNESAISRIEKFTGFTNKLSYDLKYPMDLTKDNVKIYINGEELLFTSYEYGNKPATLSYTNSIGFITLTSQLTEQAEITVEYKINQGYLNSADRIENFYNPTTGMYGKQLNQLMTGIDYGGVEVRSFDFNNVSGWDSEGWYNDIWDSYDVTFEDFILPINSFETEISLPQPLEDGIEYNVYIGQQGESANRIDDPNWITEYELLPVQQQQLEDQQAELNSLINQKTLATSQKENKESDLIAKQAVLSQLFLDLANETIGTPEYIQIVNDINAVQSDILQLEADIQVLANQLIILDNLISDQQTIISNTESEIRITTNKILASPLTNDTAVMLPIVGDGITTVYNIPEQVNNDSTAKTVIIRKTTSEGTFIPDETSYDTALTGGTFAYESAKGLSAGEIIVDGDGFVTPTTSGGPEEQVPGQVLDTVDIKVYDRIGQGSAMIVNRNHTLNYFEEEDVLNSKQALVNQAQNNYDNAISSQADSQTIDNLYNTLQGALLELQVAQNNLNDANIALDLGALPATNESVIVRIGDRIAKVSEYKIDFNNKTIKILTPPPAGTIISTTTMTTNGANILDIGTFTSDGSTTQFLTSVQWQDNLTAFVSVNGEKYSAISSGKSDRVRLVPSDETYELTNSVILDFATPLNNNDLVNYVIYASSTQTFSELTQDRFVGDGSTTAFMLNQTPFEKTPIASNIVIITGTKLLSPGYFEEFEVTSNRKYTLNLTQYPPYSLLYNDDQEPIFARLNGNNLVYGVDYIWNPDSSSLDLRSNIGTTGDLLEIFVNNSEYTIEDNIVTLTQAPLEDEEIIIYQFSNHDVLDIERQQSSVILRDWFTPGDEYFEDYAPRSRGYFSLLTEAFDVSYVWVSLNNELLIPNTDYFLVNTNDAVQIIKPIQENDRVDIVHFTGQPISSKFGFRQFKDMLNRTHYKRLNNSKETRLAQDLNYFDLRIEVEDGSVLSSPNRLKNLPGVIFINGERIEYMIKEDNTLRQLRRGTLGTSVNEYIPSNTVVSDQGPEQTVPYQDKTYVENYTAGFTQIIEADGQETTFELDKRITNYLDNTLGTLIVKTTQIDGSGFYVQTETTNYQIGVIEGKDVIIFDSAPIRTPDKLGTIEIELTNQSVFNLGFNPGQGGVNEFEVFVAGKRLRKTELDVFDFSANDPLIAKVLQPEFSINQYTLIDGTVKTDLILENAPAEGSFITVIRKQGKLWNPVGIALKDANTLQSVFLRDATIDLPK